MIQVGWWECVFDQCYVQFYGYMSQQQNMMQDYIRTSTYQRAMLDNSADFQDKVCSAAFVWVYCHSSAWSGLDSVNGSQICSWKYGIVIIVSSCFVRTLPLILVKVLQCCCFYYTQQLRWQKFCCNRTTSVEWPAVSPATFLTLATMTSNANWKHFCLNRLQHSTLWLALCVLYKYSYLLSYTTFNENCLCNHHSNHL